MKFKVVSLGCRTNQYEGQAFADQLEASGYTRAKEGEEAKLCIVNTCTVTESADASSRHHIRQLVRDNPGADVVVTGCYAERNPAAVAAIEGVTRVVPNGQKESLLPVVFPEKEWPEFAIRHFEAHTRAFVKVQDGCNSFCTYCIIPYVRGRSRSRPLEDILREVETLLAQGFLEIVLTGINIGDYEDGDKRLADLVRAVDCVPSLKRLRVSSIDPDEVDDNLMDVILNGTNTCKSMHVVLQSGSNVILKRMNRKYTRQIFLETVDKLQKASPDFTFTTDVIFGFPGETEHDFMETLDVMDQVGFAAVHAFPFSARPRTRAATYPNQVVDGIKKERKIRIQQASEKGAYRTREKYVGKTVTILTESDNGGHTDNFLYVRLPQKSVESNRLVSVTLTGNSPEGLLG